MADPFSIARTVITVVVAALQSANILSEILTSIEEGPEEVSRICRDLHAFQLLVFSLETALEDGDIQLRIFQDNLLETLVANLKDPLLNCSLTMEELKRKLLPYIKQTDAGKGYKFSKRGATRWTALGGKRDVRNILNRFMQDKMTLDSSMGVICTFCNMRSRGAKIESTDNIRPSSGDSDAGFAMKRCLEATSIAYPSLSSVVQSIGSQDEETPNLGGVQSPEVLNFKDRYEKEDRQRRAFRKAAELGNVLTIKTLLLEGAPIETKSDEGKTALHVAAQYGMEELVSVLLEHGADIHVKSSPRGRAKERKIYGDRAPLHWAATEGYGNIIQILLKNGADVAAISSRSRRPLQETVMQGHTTCAKLLIANGAPINAQDDKGWGALHDAAHFGRHNISKVLLDHGADIDLVSADSDHGKESNNRLGRRTPLLVAAQIPHLDIIHLLLDRRANIEARNNFGETAMHLGAESGHLTVVLAMLDAGADMESKDYVAQETPLFKAAMNGHISIVMLLTRRGARRDHVNLQGNDILQHARLHSAGNGDILRILSGVFKKA